MGSSHSNYYQCYDCKRVYRIYDDDYKSGRMFTKEEWMVQEGEVRRERRAKRLRVTAP